MYYQIVLVFRFDFSNHQVSLAFFAGLLGQFWTASLCQLCQLCQLLSHFHDMPLNMESPITTIIVIFLLLLLWWADLIFVYYIYFISFLSLGFIIGVIAVINPLLLLAMKFQRIHFYHFSKKLWDCIFSVKCFLMLIPCFLKVLQLTENLLHDNVYLLRTHLLKFTGSSNFLSTNILKIWKIFKLC